MGTDQRKDAKRGYADSTSMLESGYGAARGNLSQGFNKAETAYGQARGDVTGGYGNALSALQRGTSQAVGALQPFAQSGQQANTLYGNALGLNGGAAQQTFMRDYAGGDPFRASNAEFATNALMQALNARGLSGSGYAANAVASENLKRGSQDYESYMNRLGGMQQQGLGVAQNISGLYADQGAKAAQYGYNQGSDLANIQGQRAATGYNYGGALAGLDTDLATTKAGNRVNLGNALAASRSIGPNNLLQLGGLALKAYNPGGFGGGGYTGSIAGGA
ncbi:MAG: hypothetical protein IPM06_18030 [Rhizobiales bacterium]|nr:hypothetical protein [Hyphomicrobiales bacterium]